MKQNITRHTYPCRNPECHNVTANYDGYCDECVPPEEELFSPHTIIHEKDEFYGIPD